VKSTGFRRALSLGIDRDLINEPFCLEIITIGGQFLQFTHIAEIIREAWRKIG
jgi:hypothetical protein